MEIDKFKLEQEKMDDERYGTIDIFSNPETDEKVCVKSRTFSDSKKFQEYANSLEKRKNLNCTNLLKLECVELNLEEMTISVMYEYLPLECSLNSSPRI